MKSGKLLKSGLPFNKSNGSTGLKNSMLQLKMSGKSYLMDRQIFAVRFRP